MSLHVSDLAWKISDALNADCGVQTADTPELVKRDEEQGYPERDGIWRIVVHGDLRDLEVVVVVRA